MSESGKQKPWTHFLLKIQILNREWWSHLPMKGKTLGSHSRERIFGVLFLFQLFIGKWPSHSRFKIWILSKKWVMGFCLLDSLKSQPLACKTEKTIHWPVPMADSLNWFRPKRFGTWSVASSLRLSLISSSKCTRALSILEIFCRTVTFFDFSDEDFLFFLLRRLR